jgi:hypothetical protein
MLRLMLGLRLSLRLPIKWTFLLHHPLSPSTIQRARSPRLLELKMVIARRESATMARRQRKRQSESARRKKKRKKRKNESPKNCKMTAATANEGYLNARKSSERSYKACRLHKELFSRVWNTRCVPAEGMSAWYWECVIIILNVALSLYHSTGRARQAFLDKHGAWSAFLGY